MGAREEFASYANTDSSKPNITTKRQFPWHLPFEEDVVAKIAQPPLVPLLLSHFSCIQFHIFTKEHLDSP